MNQDWWVTGYENEPGFKEYAAGAEYPGHLTSDLEFQDVTVTNEQLSEMTSRIRKHERDALLARIESRNDPFWDIVRHVTFTYTTPEDGTTFTREDGSHGVWINGLPRTIQEG